MNRLELIHLLVTVLLTTDGILAGVLDCETDGDCIDEANCVNNICECSPGYVFSTNGYQCLQYSVGYGSSCEDDAQCSWLMGKYYCNSGLCDCESGYRYLHGKCVLTKGLGETCTRNEDCHVTNYLSAMVCSSEGICICNEGYYARGGYDCRPEVTEVGDYCSLSSDCKIENASCVTGRCAIVSAKNGEGIEKVGETFTALATNTVDIVTYEIGSSCTTSIDCEDENSICSPLINECVCKRGYYYSSGQGCIAELGIDFGCTNPTECARPKLCVDGACQCPNYYYYNNLLQACIRVPYSPDYPCSDHSYCQILGKNAVCVDEITRRTCKCALNFVLNDDYICEPVDSEVCDSDACVLPSDCAVTNAVCTGGRCSCADNYRLENDTCLPNIGGGCDFITRTCNLENTVCTSGVCSCTEGFTPIDDRTCIVKASGLYDDCEYDIQCSTIQNSACLSKQCKCVDNYVDNEGQCLQVKSYGDYCANVKQCHYTLGENIQCRNSICQCPADMMRTDDGLDCTTRKGDDATSLQKSYLLFTLIFLIYYI